MNLNRVSPGRHLSGKCFAWAIAMVLMLAGAAQGQPDSAGGPDSSGSWKPVKSPTPPPAAPASDDGMLQTVLMVAGAIVALVVVVLVVRILMKKMKEHAGSSADPVTPDRGVVLNGFRFQNHISTGQSSQVWEVVEGHSGRHFAMKTLLPEKAREADMRQFLFHEAEVGRELAHPNIIRIVKVDHSKHNPNFIMEFFPSGSLKLKIMHKHMDFIREHGHSILKQAATALAFMNAKGWLHRDIKPDNILVNASGEVRIIDFALARRIRTGFGLFRKPKCQGTRSYMSPEQILCKRLDGRSDIYSFAAMAYEMVTGRPPFRGADSRDLLRKHLSEKPVSPEFHNPQVTKEFADFLLRMLAKKKEERPKDFHEVLMKLKTISVFKGQKVQAGAS